MDSGPAGAVRSLHTTVFFSPQSWCLLHTGKPTRKYQQPSRGHQEITAAFHEEATARDLIPKISFICKDPFQIFPPLILALPNPPPSQIIHPPVGGKRNFWPLWHRSQTLGSVGRPKLTWDHGAGRERGVAYGNRGFAPPPPRQTTKRRHEHKSQASSQRRRGGPPPPPFKRNPAAAEGGTRPCAAVPMPVTSPLPLS